MKINQAVKNHKSPSIVYGFTQTSCFENYITEKERTQLKCPSRIEGASP